MPIPEVGFNSRSFSLVLLRKQTLYSVVAVDWFLLENSGYFLIIAFIRLVEAAHWQGLEHVPTGQPLKLHWC